MLSPTTRTTKLLVVFFVVTQWEILLPSFQKPTPNLSLPTPTPNLSLPMSTMMNQGETSTVDTILPKAVSNPYEAPQQRERTPVPTAAQTVAPNNAVPITASASVPSSKYDFRSEIWAMHQLVVPQVHRRAVVSKSQLRPPYENVIMCPTLKSGSTSIFNFLYQGIFNRSWPEFNSLEFTNPHDQSSPRWQGVFNETRMSDVDLVNWLQNDNKNSSSTFSLAFIRDPKERLISAWKSKITCDDVKYGTNVIDRKRIIKNLYYQSGNAIALEQGTAKECLNMSDFLRLMYQCHERGTAGGLDEHLVPQDAHCFRHVAPENWSLVVALSDAPNLGQHLSHDVLGLNFANPQIPHSHKSGGWADLSLTEEDQDLLDKITHQERILLEPYLKK